MHANKLRLAFSAAVSTDQNRRLCGTRGQRQFSFSQSRFFHKRIHHFSFAYKYSKNIHSYKQSHVLKIQAPFMSSLLPCRQFSTSQMLSMVIKAGCTSKRIKDDKTSKSHGIPMITKSLINNVNLKCTFTLSAARTPSKARTFLCKRVVCA